MICAGGDFVVGVARKLPRRRKAARSISNCLSCRWKRPRWRGCCAITASMSSSIASACCRTAPAATRPPCIAISSRLLQAIRESDRAIRLVHISIPGTSETDRTAFSTTKREAERLIAESGVAFTILRPGFVVALAAYGGSAMVRSLAAFPLDLPAAERAAPFQPVAMEDIAATIAWLAARDPAKRTP